MGTTEFLQQTDEYQETVQETSKGSNGQSQEVQMQSSPRGDGSLQISMDKQDLELYIQAAQLLVLVYIALQLTQG